jgi:hypothetical protein
VAERVHHADSNDDKCHNATNTPEPFFIFVRILDAFEVHSVVTSKEGQGEEDDGDSGKDKNGFVLAIRDDCELVLLNGAKLEELVDH